MDGMDRVKKVQPLNISKDWCTAVNSTFESQTRHSPTVIVCGAKGSGKSTLCRLVPLHLCCVVCMLTICDWQFMCSSIQFNSAY